MKVNYLGYAGIALFLAVITGLMLPVMANNPNQATMFEIDSPYVKLGIEIVIGLLTVGLSLLLFQNRHSNNQEVDHVNLVMVPLALLLWFGLVIYLDIKPEAHNMLMTIPVMLLGFGALLTAVSLDQKQNVDQRTSKDKNSDMSLGFIATLVAIYAVIFYGLTISVISGLLVALSVLVIGDVNWPTNVTRLRRKIIKDKLLKSDVVVQDWAILNELGNVKNIVIEKSGILTEPVAKIYSVKSVDERYSDNDVIGIAAGLMANFASPLSQGFLEYAQSQGVVPSQVSEPEKNLLVGISGVIHQERFSIVSAEEALSHYDVSADYLATFAQIGNSVVYIIDSLQVVGVLNYSTPWSYEVIGFDRSLARRKIHTQVLSTDNNGSMQDLANLLKTANVLKSGLSPEEKLAAQLKILGDEHSLLITNQQIPKGMPNRPVIELGDSLPNADIQIKHLNQVELLFKTADQLRRTNGWKLRWQMFWVGLLFILTAALGAFAGKYIFFAPLVAVAIRLALSTWFSRKIKK